MLGAVERSYKFGPFRLDAVERVLLCRGDPTPLTPKAFETLLTLVKHHGRVVSKDDLIRWIWPDAVVVRFKELGASSLDIEIMAWFQVPEWSDFQVCRQEVLIGFMQVVEQAGTSIAFPTRTVHLHVEEGRFPGPDGPGPRLTG